MGDYENVLEIESGVQHYECTVANGKLYVRWILPQFFKDMPVAFKRRKIPSRAYGLFPCSQWGMGEQVTVQKGEEEKGDPEE